MSSLIKVNTFFNGLASDESATAQELFPVLAPALERKLHTIADNMLIAEALETMRDRHGYKSLIYKQFIDKLADLDPIWEDKNNRYVLKQAQKGFKHLNSIGSPEDHKKISAKCQSLDAMATCSEIPEHLLHSFSTKVKSRSKFPSRPEIRSFIKTGEFDRQTSKCSKTAPSNLEKALKLVQDYPDLVELIQAKLDLA